MQEPGSETAKNRNVFSSITSACSKPNCREDGETGSFILPVLPSSRQKIILRNPY
jgi:hypothetical protein